MNLSIQKGEHWVVSIPSSKWESLGVDINAIETYGAPFDNLPNVDIIATHNTACDGTPFVRFHWQFQDQDEMKMAFSAPVEAGLGMEDLINKWAPVVLSDYIDWDLMELPPLGH